MESPRPCKTSGLPGWGVSGCFHLQHPPGNVHTKWVRAVGIAALPASSECGEELSREVCSLWTMEGGGKG